VANGGRVVNTRLGCFESQVLWSWSDHYRSSAEGGKVSALKIVAILLIAAGIIGLVYGGITYTKTTHNAKVGPFELSVKDKETVNIPVWAGVGAIVVGALLLFVRTKE
jgi:uncharacterized membrane protein YidH (DUF202 family)